MSSSVEKESFRKLWLSNGLPEAALSHLNLSKDPNYVVQSSFKLGNAAQTSIGLSALSAAHFHALRTGRNQDVTVDARHAILEFHSEAWYLVDDKLPEGDVWDSIAGVYKTKDNNFVRIQTNFPHHRCGILSILNVPTSPTPTKASVSEALLKWNAIEFETEAAVQGMCATAQRSFAEWDQHPQGKALAGVPPVALVKIGDAPKRGVSGNYIRPLDKIRVLDLCRVLAGPVCGRTLAAHGADVLLITSPNLPSLPRIDTETSRGKRTTQLDLTLPSDRETLSTLVKDADVFLQAYRPGSLSAKGFGPEELANLHPGIVCANLTAWGWEGPWKGRRGFDSLVQTATGFNTAEAEAFNKYHNSNVSGSVPLQPRALPVQALDHAAGYFLAFGINAALCKTVTEGGSWEVQVSLAAVGQWIRSLGRLSPDQAFINGQSLPPSVLPQDPEIAALMATSNRSKSNSYESAGDGNNNVVSRLSAIRHAAILSATPVREGPSSEAPMALDVHSASWLAL